MKIITPPQNLKAAHVEIWSLIKKEAKDLVALIDARDFEGKWKDAFAISHAQVSDCPYSFFVIHREKAWIFSQNRVIINAKILSTEGKLIKSKEACMGYPHDKVSKVGRYHKIKFEFYVLRKMNKFKHIVSLNFRNPKLERMELELTGLPAFIVQHEVDHSNGITIYDEERSYSNRSKNNK